MSLLPSMLWCPAHSCCGVVPSVVWRMVTILNISCSMRHMRDSSASHEVKLYAILTVWLLQQPFGSFFWIVRYSPPFV